MYEVSYGYRRYHRTTKVHKLQAGAGDERTDGRHRGEMLGPLRRIISPLLRGGLSRALAPAVLFVISHLHSNVDLVDAGRERFMYLSRRFDFGNAWPLG
eukprot:scaffold73294_cov47-Prasinocladus_malaysianus.AAC.2